MKAQRLSPTVTVCSSGVNQLFIKYMPKMLSFEQEKNGLVNQISSKLISRQEQGGLGGHAAR